MKQKVWVNESVCFGKNPDGSTRYSADLEREPLCIYYKGWCEKGNTVVRCGGNLSCSDKIQRDRSK